MEPTNYYVDNTIRVNSLGIFLHDRWYKLDSIKSVEVRRFRTDRVWLNLIPYCALTALILFIRVWSDGDSSLGIVAASVFVVLGIVSLIGAAYGVFMMLSEKLTHVHVVRIQVSSVGINVAAYMHIADAQAVAMPSVMQRVSRIHRELPHLATRLELLFQRLLMTALSILGIGMCS
jgi:hypothetical protein